MSIRIIADSGSDIVNYGREELTVLPMTITFQGVEYLDSVNLSHREFYEKLVESDELPTTSQIAPYRFEEEIKKAKDKGEDVLIITISSELSGTYQSACIAASDYEGVRVIDALNVAVGERVLVDRAFDLMDQGKTLDEIADDLDECRNRVRELAVLDTLEYLKKGGRISPAVAFAGNVLNIKPVVTVEEGKVVLLGKARGSKQGNNFLRQQCEKTGIDFSMPICLGYTGFSDEMIKKYAHDSAVLWKDYKESLPIVSIGGTIGTHVGPGAIAVAFFEPK